MQERREVRNWVTGFLAPHDASTVGQFQTIKIVTLECLNGHRKRLDLHLLKANTYLVMVFEGVS